MLWKDKGKISGKGNKEKRKPFKLRPSEAVTTLREIILAAFNSVASVRHAEPYQQRPQVPGSDPPSKLWTNTRWSLLGSHAHRALTQRNLSQSMRVCAKRPDSTLSSSCTRKQKSHQKVPDMDLKTVCTLWRTTRKPWALALHQGRWKVPDT